MSYQEPVLYNLKFSVDYPYWRGVEDRSRRVFLMPLSNPAEFVAFGVFDPSNTVLFVARGRVGERLGDFLERMKRSGADVELYERVPLPWPLVKRYTSDDPFDGSETSPPKGSTDAGRISYAGGAGPSLWEAVMSVPISDGPTWPAQYVSARKVFIMPLPGHEEFLALGVCTDVPESGKHLFVFAARGEVAVHLDGFVARMRATGTYVGLCDWPSLSFLQQYVAAAFPKAFDARSILPSNGVSTLSTSTQQIAA
ncbi:hypothetical protein JRI60_48760 [Archangium violaceum]|uniref:hypothetical protein n=1 Tax=Archangium violaceum TaxID=83451 RepID=UPI0019506BBD|nr:hypothetical protein [Archangium violaceum]QRN96792.1 hypothetical protein JRI60_48760 [Archangium violaceum]